jgi:starvation-inducible DNA-binding protein
MTNTTNIIGLDQKKAEKLVNQLNQLLADYKYFYQNVHGFHWNITGDKFFELHVKFEELYNNLFIKIDEIAERILALGGKPLHTYESYAKITNIKAKENISDPKEAVKSLLEGLKILLIQEREILNFSDEANDEGTNSLMSDYIREQEQLAWMYRSFMA